MERCRRHSPVFTSVSTQPVSMIMCVSSPTLSSRKRAESTVREDASTVRMPALAARSKAAVVSGDMVPSERRMVLSMSETSSLISRFTGILPH